MNCLERIHIIENTGTHLFLTGKAGTGKTTFLKRLREHTPKRMVVLAPTGIAAINAGGIGDIITIGTAVLAGAGVVEAPQNK